MSMPSKIFGTVWAHGLRGRMLSKNELHTLAESRDIDELVTRMKNTVYLDALAKLPKSYTAEKAESALREVLCQCNQQFGKYIRGIRGVKRVFYKVHYLEP